MNKESLKGMMKEAKGKVMARAKSKALGMKKEMKKEC